MSRRRHSFGSVAVLHAIASGDRFGFDIMEATGLTSGSVYPTLERLADDGFVRSRWEDVRIARRDKRPPRRYFDLTARGIEALTAGLERFRNLRPVTIPPGAKKKRA